MCVFITHWITGQVSCTYFMCVTESHFNLTSLSCFLNFIQEVDIRTIWSQFSAWNPLKPSKRKSWPSAMKQISLLAAGCQPWNRDVCAASGDRFAYCATLAVYIYQVSLQLLFFIALNSESDESMYIFLHSWTVWTRVQNTHKSKEQNLHLMK